MLSPVGTADGASGAAAELDADSSRWQGRPVRGLVGVLHHSVTGCFSAVYTTLVSVTGQSDMQPLTLHLGVFSTCREAACTRDLVALGLNQPPAVTNEPPRLYSASNVSAAVAHLHHLYPYAVNADQVAAAGQRAVASGAKLNQVMDGDLPPAEGGDAAGPSNTSDANTSERRTFSTTAGQRWPKTLATMPSKQEPEPMEDGSQMQSLTSMDAANRMPETLRRHEHIRTDSSTAGLSTQAVPAGSGIPGPVTEGLDTMSDGLFHVYVDINGSLMHVGAYGVLQDAQTQFDLVCLGTKGDIKNSPAAPSSYTTLQVQEAIASLVAARLLPEFAVQHSWQIARAAGCRELPPVLVSGPWLNFLHYSSLEKSNLSGYVLQLLFKLGFARRVTLCSCLTGKWTWVVVGPVWNKLPVRSVNTGIRVLNAGLVQVAICNMG
mmetsp:Transcript_28967/g.85730  ORF Transcript_28967/g.85730 Transcript_28967/m.85730 type:complete len:435 (+) Transcript_28967:203-1507(+)